MQNYCSHAKIILRKLSFLLVIMSPILLGCTPNSNEIAQPNVQPFFDLASYFQNEVDRLKDLNRIEKTTLVNGEEETKIIDSLNIEKELAIFSKADINRTAWLDKYKVDSLLNNNNELIQLKYSALDEKLKTKTVVIDFKNDAVHSISIENITKSFISDTNQISKYFPATGFQIERNQKIPFIESQQFIIEVKFL